MTQKEHMTAVLEAYRQGYRDGVDDKKPIQATYPAVAGVDETAFELYNQAIANLMNFDGSAQEPVEYTVARTRAR